MVNDEREKKGRKVSTTSAQPAEVDGATSTATSSQMAPPTYMPQKVKGKKKSKFPCGKCGEEAKGQTICCQICEAWFHVECVPGMTKEYFENCKLSYELDGNSTFLCMVCRKFSFRMNKALKDLTEEVRQLTN